MQVFGTLMNSLVAREFNAITSVSCTFVLALSQATLVKLATRPGSFLPLLMFAFLMINCFLAVAVVLGVYAQIYENSMKLKCNMHINRTSRPTTKRERDYMTRFHRSCSDIKVHLGPINFVDSLTPLTFVDFANDLAIQLLLVDKL